jgi:hypothetical protein
MNSFCSRPRTSAFAEVSLSNERFSGVILVGKKQLIISALSMIALALAATAANAQTAIADSAAADSAAATMLLASASAPAPIRAVPMSHMETTNTTESAPLNLVNRTFSRIEPFLDATLELQRLTYRAHESAARETIDEAALKQLLVDISGEEDAFVSSLELASTEVQLRSSLEAVTPASIWASSAAADLVSTDAFADFSAVANAQSTVMIEAGENFAGAVKAALIREDVKVYSAVIENGAESSRVFILVDEETSDILVLSVTKSKAKSVEVPVSPSSPARG